MTKGGLSDGHCVRVHRAKNYMRHYHDCTSRLFSDGRQDNYLNEAFLNAAKNGDYERVQNFLARTSRNASVNVDAKDKKGGFTAVMLAAMNEHRKVVSLLLNYGADITLCNNKGKSVLDFAPDSMRPLLLGSVARQGYSSRHLLQAAWQGNVHLVKKLLSSKSMLDVNCTNADGLTPLLLVTRDLNLFQKIEKAVMDSAYHPVEVVKELINHNADCDAKDSEGKRPLHLAAYGKGSHARDVVDVLIENGVTEIDVPDRFCNSPLHWATKEDNQPILLALIKGGANVNAKGYIGRTPLHIAASHGYEKTSDTLLHHGADVTLTDDHGLSPVDVAKGRRVQVVLKDAWADQTKNSKLQSKRIFSAPGPPHVQKDSAQLSPEFTEQRQSTEQETTVQISTTPRQGVQRLLKKRAKSSSTAQEITVLDERTNVPVSRKTSDVRMPRIPSAQGTDVLSPGSRSNSVFAGRLQSREQELAEIKDMKTSEAPSLSVYNIELKYVRNLRGERQVLRNRRLSSQQPVPPNHRLRHRLSSPVLTYQRRISPPSTPDRDVRLRSSSTSQVRNSRLAFPSRVPPLEGRTALTPELRSVTTPEQLVNENVPLVPNVVDLDLLRNEGRPSGTPTSSVFLSEVRETTPPPPSPRGTSRASSRSSNKSQGDGELEPSQAQFPGRTEMTQTFTSIPRSSFWIPVDKKSTENSERPSVERKGESSSSGTKFYIDLGNLEALASGQCSLCGDSLPEGSSALTRGSIQSSPEKELCKSCTPRRGSNEDVFWIPFTDKRKATALKTLNGVENGEDSAKAGERRKSNDKIPEQIETKDQAKGRQRQPTCDEEKSDGKALVLANNTSNLNMPSFPDMTGFDVSCVCDNSTGLCSCTIVKKDLPSPTRGNTPSSSSPRAKKEHCDITLKSFSESDLHNPTTTQRNSEEIKDGSGEATQSVHSPGAKLPSTQEVLNKADLSEPMLETAIEPSSLKQAWTTPRSEEPGASTVTIVNPFPSPVPPMDTSAVHPPIGPAGDRRTLNRKLTGLKKGKKSVGKPCCNSKHAKPKTKNKAPEQSNKGSKKKRKGRKKGDMKMITVQQRGAGEELGLRTISQGGLDVAEESMDYLSTLRPFNARTFKAKHPILSPIPESPRSSKSSPRSPSTITSPRLADLPEGLRERSKYVEEGNAKDFSEVRATGEGAVLNNEGDALGGEFDVVDGGMMSRFIAMCVPRLKLGNSELECDSASDDERTELLLKHPQGGGDGRQQRERVDTRSAGDADDRLSIHERRDEPQVIQDEADDVMEEIIKRGLNSELEREKVAAQSDLRSAAGTDDSLTNVNHTRASIEEESVLSFRYSRDRLPEVLAEPDEANEELPSCETSSYSEQYSDTDSSYNSIGSTSPRPESSASSLNSSDTYFSSPRDSSGGETPTPGRDISSENSIEIEYYERMAREKSRVSSGSSSSNSTIRTQSNVSLGSLGNISQGSVGSFSGLVTDSVVRSRLSASVRSQSSESCEEEIVWKKGNVLGKGAFGTVWLGLTNMGEMIAVKQVELNHSNLDEAEKQYETLLEEVSLLKSLKHENIVKFIGTCLDGSVVNIFMEYVPGGSIASILAQFGSLEEPVFRLYTKQLLSGVSYLHSNNVIHRDIKGGNILIMPSGVLKLIDFGCAKRLYMNLSMSRSNILRSMKGTPHWMAPEVIRETGHGRKSDIWSVGCTVFEMATRKPPWSDMPRMTAIFAIGSGSVPVPQLSEDFSPDARDFVHRCLTRDPDFRPSADELLQHPFVRTPQ